MEANTDLCDWGPRSGSAPPSPMGFQQPGSTLTLQKVAAHVSHTGLHLCTSWTEQWRMEDSESHASWQLPGWGARGGGWGRRSGSATCHLRYRWFSEVQTDRCSGLHSRNMSQTAGLSDTASRGHQGGLDIKRPLWVPSYRLRCHEKWSMDGGEYGWWEAYSQPTKIVAPTLPWLVLQMMSFPELGVAFRFCTSMTATFFLIHVSFFTFIKVKLIKSSFCTTQQNDTWLPTSITVSLGYTFPSSGVSVTGPRKEAESGIVMGTVTGWHIG